jgi:hypothetical protein
VGLLLLILLLLLLVGGLPSWRYSRGLGYGPSGLVTLLLIILLIFVFTDMIGWNRWYFGRPVP